MTSLLEAFDDPLAGPGEPDLLALCRAVPPLVGPTFLGSREMPDKRVVRPDATVVGAGLEPLEIAPGDLTCHGDMLPAVLRAVGRTRTGREVTRLLFVHPTPADLWEVDLGAEMTARRWNGGVAREEAPAAAEAALAEVVGQQAAELAAGVEFQAPELLRRCARLSILRSLNSCWGHRPRGGWRSRASDERDGRPALIVALTHALLDVGLLTPARELLGFWLAFYVDDDGALADPTASLTDWGRLLDVAVRLVRVTRDRAWYDEARPLLCRLADWLVARRAASGGLVPAEADREARGETVGRAYFGANLWAVRGLGELAGLLAEGQAYDAVGQAWLADLHGVMRADTVALDERRLFLPPSAGLHDPPARLTADQATSHANARHYVEMLSSRLLTPEQAGLIRRLREHHGGEISGHSRFLDGLDCSLAAELGLAHLDDDRPVAAQRLLLGQLALNHAAGHQTAYERCPLIADGPHRRAADDDSPIAQCAVPRLLRHCLAHETPDGLFLNQAAPLTWLAEGCGVTDAPTRWGRLSYRVAADSDGLVGEVDATDIHPEVRVRLRLRRPDGAAVRRLEVDGRPVELAGDTVTLTRRPRAIAFRAE